MMKTLTTEQDFLNLTPYSSRIRSFNKNGKHYETALFEGFNNGYMVLYWLKSGNRFSYSFSSVVNEIRQNRRIWKLI